MPERFRTKSSPEIPEFRGFRKGFNGLGQKWCTGIEGLPGRKSPLGVPEV